MTDCCNLPPMDAATTRRRFLTTAALGGGAAFLSGFIPSVARARGSTEMLLLTCMDYRLVDSIPEYMNKRGLHGKYDHVVLAGASLGALTDKQPAWAETFWGHLDVAIKLHHVHRVMIMDHRDCGAYKVFLGEEAVKDEAAEFKSHVAQLYRLRGAVLVKHPHMEVELGLMALDGSVTQVV